MATYTAEDPEGTEISWQLEGSDAEHLQISDEGVLTFIESPDYENPVDSRLNNTYEIRIIVAVDSGNPPQPSGRLQVVIEIKDVDLPGIPVSYDANDDETIDLQEAIVAVTDFSHRAQSPMKMR